MSKTVEVLWLEHCNKCGCGIAIIETEEGTEDLLFDGDKILCPSCGHTGQVAVTDDYAEDCVAYAVWNDIESKQGFFVSTDEILEINGVAVLANNVMQSLKEVS